MSAYAKLPPLRSFPPEVLAEIEADDARFATCLECACDEAAGEVEGLHQPDSLAWTIYREPILMVGGIRAILLQLAHPAVAAGVDQNSTFREDVRGRAHRTFGTTYPLVFGDLRAACGAARRFHNIHNRVRGAIRAGMDTVGAGGVYRGNDPALLRWVQATLIDTALLVYEQVVRPLSPDEQRRFYEGERRCAILLGLPPEHCPATWEDFRAYYGAMLEGPDLEVGQTARELAHTIFNVRGLTRWTRLDEVLTAGLLPARWRAAYGLPWGEREQRLFARWMGGLRLLHRWTPPTLRAVPAYHQARLRVALARDERPARYGRLVNWLDQRVNLPLSLRPVEAEESL